VDVCDGQWRQSVGGDERTAERYVSDRLKNRANFPARSPISPKCIAIAGLLEYDGSRPEKALTRLRRATEFQPSHRDAYRRLGQLYDQRASSRKLFRLTCAPGILRPQIHGFTRSWPTRTVCNLISRQRRKSCRKAVELTPDRPLFSPVTCHGQSGPGAVQPGGGRDAVCDEPTFLAIGRASAAARIRLTSADPLSS